jgi:S-formylglutathione hydrolase
MKLISSTKSFDGFVEKLEHDSNSTNTKMTLTLYKPNKKVVGALMWLSGLTCNEDNFITKAGAIKLASELGIILVCPDTSPRGTDLDGEHDHWDFGSGAGFYLDATISPWDKNYNMYSYISRELPKEIESHLEMSHLNWSISGHSMGGHGALTIGIKHSDFFKSISAFAPICAPKKSPWGKKAFTNYLGENNSLWDEYDSSILLRKSHSKLNILIDQGTKDSFVENELMPSEITEVAKSKDINFKLNFREGYDHSYFFISTFIEEHLRFHYEFLKL